MCRRKDQHHAKISHDRKMPPKPNARNGSNADAAVGDGLHHPDQGGSYRVHSAAEDNRHHEGPPKAAMA
jgi:hypothetical protein